MIMLCEAKVKIIISPQFIPPIEVGEFLLLLVKTDDYETAADGKRRLTDFLDVQGFLLHEDALKTTEIYNSLIQYLSSEPAP